MMRLWVPATAKKKTQRMFDRRRMPGPRRTRKDGIRVCVLDVMCYTPEYDLHLVEALTRLNPDITLAAIDFPHDPEILDRASLQRDPDVVDRVNRKKWLPGPVKPPLKGAEYALNLHRLSRRLPERGVQVAHLQWSPFVESLPLGIWFIQRLKKSGVKTVHTVHNIVPHDTGAKAARRYKRLYGLPDALICHTENARQQIIEGQAVPAEKVWVIPHGPMGHMEAPMDRKTARERLGLEEKEVAVLLFGNVRPYKGVEDLIQAWTRVQKETPQARLLIAGGGEKRYLRRIAHTIEELGLTDTVRTDFGWIDPDMMLAYHAASDILAYPYRNITQSGALMAGMRHARAILATDLPAFRGLLTDDETGRLVPVGDDQALQEALVTMIRDGKTRRKQGKAAHRRWKSQVAGEASWDRVAEKTLKCYQALVGDPA